MTNDSIFKTQSYINTESISPKIIDKYAMLNDWYVIIIISIIWGLGLAFLFRKACTNDQCVVVKVPLNLEKNNHIIYSNKKCYRLERYNTHCEY